MLSLCSRMRGSDTGTGVAGLACLPHYGREAVETSVLLLLGFRHSVTGTSGGRSARNHTLGLSALFLCKGCSELPRSGQKGIDESFMEAKKKNTDESIREKVARGQTKSP